MYIYFNVIYLLFFFPNLFIKLSCILYVYLSISYYNLLANIVYVYIHTHTHTKKKTNQHKETRQIIKERKIIITDLNEIDIMMSYT